MDFPRTSRVNSYIEYIHENDMIFGYIFDSIIVPVFALALQWNNAVLK